MQKLTNIQIYKNVNKFWDSYFHGVDEVTIDQLLIAFFYYIKEGGDYDLQPQQLINIRNIIDYGYRGTANIRQFCLFYENFWNNATERRKILKTKSEVTTKYQTDPIFYKVLFLKAEKVPKGSLIKQGEELQIVELEPKDFETDLYIDKSFGKDGCDFELVKKDDPFFHRELFRLTRTMEGFKMKCVSSNQRLMYKVESKPFFLYEGMIIQVGLNTRYKVTYAHPKPLKGKYNEFIANPEFYQEDFLNFSKSRLYKTMDEIREEYEKYLDGILVDSKDDQMKVRLECIKGANKGAVIDLEHQITGKTLEFVFGRLKDGSDIHIDEMTVSNKHCSIKFDLAGFYLVEENPTAFGTYILFPTVHQYEKGKFSHSLKVDHGMKIRFDDFIFSLDIRNVVRPGAEELARRFEQSRDNMSQSPKKTTLKTEESV